MCVWHWFVLNSLWPSEAPMATYIWATIGSGKVWLSDGTKPLTDLCLPVHVPKLLFCIVNLQTILLELRTLGGQRVSQVQSLADRNVWSFGSAQVHSVIITSLFKNNSVKSVWRKALLLSFPLPGTVVCQENSLKLRRWQAICWSPDFYWLRLTLIPAWISDYTHYKVWGEIIYPLPNFNGAAVEVWPVTLDICRLNQFSCLGYQLTLLTEINQARFWALTY